MTSKHDNFIRELREDFKVEAVEHLQELSDLLIKLENDSGHERKALIEKIFRETHSLKGAARAVNLLHIEQLSMAWENVLHKLKSETLLLAPYMFDVFFKTVDLLQEWVKRIELQPTLIHDNLLKEIIASFDSFEQQSAPLTRKSLFFDLDKDENKIAVVDKPESNIEPPKGESIEKQDKPISLEFQTQFKADEPLTDLIKHETNERETIRIPVSRLTDLLRKTDELIVLKNMLQFQHNQLQEKYIDLSEWYFKHINADGNADRMNADLSAYLETHIKSLGKIKSAFFHIERTATKDIDDLLFDVKRSLLQPFSILTAVVPKIVRDLSKLYNKDVSLHITGLETEVDRRILETLKDPLIHLVRNAIDHGIETVEERKKKNKPAKANLWISMQQDDHQILKLVIRDDGRGIDRKNVIRSAIKNGILEEESEAAKLTDKEVFNLIFASGVSTTDFITDISGRGLGMAIVAEKVQEIEGTIEVDSKADEGTIFTLSLPQSLATFNGMLIQSASQQYIVPTKAIIIAKRYTKNDIQMLGSKSVVLHENDRIAVINLAQLLGLRVKSAILDQNKFFPCLILTDGRQKLAVIVDLVIGEYEGVLKPFGPQLKHVNNFSGAMLMGDGQVVPVLNPSEIVLSASVKAKQLSESFSHESTAEDTSERNILVAEDSITVRNMLRNILENAGFNVKTAVDGQQAFEFLSENTFDLVVSDVEMPRMNGFELTRNIKAHPDYSSLPVILVTALESAEDRQKGMEAGANAYIVKGSFEKSNLIETINRLI